jgi:hypothetical protein
MWRYQDQSDRRAGSIKSIQIETWAGGIWSNQDNWEAVSEVFRQNTYHVIKVKVKFSRYRPEQALGDPVG